MKWTDEKIEDLKALCFNEAKNSEIAEHFGVPVAEIHAKRSQLGITIPKVNAMKAGTVAPKFERALSPTPISRLNWLKRPDRTAGDIADFIGGLSGCPQNTGSYTCPLETRYGDNLEGVPDAKISDCCRECTITYLLGDMEATSK